MLRSLVGMRLQIVGKEKHLENGKQDEQLDENNCPQHPAQGHGAKSVVVEAEDAMEYVGLCHIVNSWLSKQIYRLFFKFIRFFPKIANFSYNKVIGRGFYFVVCDKYYTFANK